MIRFKIFRKRETEKLFFSEVSKAAGRLLDSGVSEVIVTGVLFEEQDAAKECTVGKETGTGGRKVANLTVTREKTTAGISSLSGQVTREQEICSLP